MEQVGVVKSDDNESDENEEYFYFFLAWLLAIFVEFFKVNYLGLQSSDQLIGLNLWSQEIFVYFGRIFVYFEKWLLLISTAINFWKFKN